MADLSTLAIIAAAGLLGGAMNGLAGGGTFATLPALIAFGLPANIANATSNVALLPGAAMSAWAFRDEMRPVGPLGMRLLAAVTFASGLAGAALLVATPSRTFDIIIPWLLLFAFVVLAFGRPAADWLHARVAIGRRTMLATQLLLGAYGGYFGGGVGLMMMAAFSLLAHVEPRAMFGPRTLMLTMCNAAAAIVFAATGMIAWAACLPMIAGTVAGGWLGALIGKRLSHRAVRVWTLIVTGGTTLVFFVRAYS